MESSSIRAHPPPSAGVSHLDTLLLSHGDQHPRSRERLPKALLAYHLVWSSAPTPGQPAPLRGFALVVLRLQNMLNQILVPPNFSPRDICVQLFELDASGTPQVLARSDDANARHETALQIAYPISFRGRGYGAVMQPGTAFLIARRHQAS